MKYAEVIHDAWEMTQDSAKLKWFAFVPSFVAVLVFMGKVAWQMHSYLTDFGVLQNPPEKFTIFLELIDFLVDNNLLTMAIFSLIFVIFFVFVLPSWIQATMILGIRHNFEDPEGRFSLRGKMIEGFGYFFKLFELRGLLGMFELVTIVFTLLSVYHVWKSEIFVILMPVIVVYICFAIFVNFFTAFAPYFVVCSGKDVLSSIKKSFGLVFMNLGRTFAVIMLMFLVNFRIIINVLVILGVPFGLLLGVSYFASSEWLGFAIFVAVILGFGAVCFTAYLTAIIEVFSMAVWERTFTTLQEETAEQVIIGGDE